jgi:hypothetical protein
MFKKIVEFFTGKKPESKFAHPLDAVTTPNPGHPGWPIPVPQAPYKLEPPAATTPIPYVPANEPPLVKLGPEPTPVPDAAPTKKKQTFAKKPAAAKTPAAKAPAKPRANKTP